MHRGNGGRQAPLGFASISGSRRVCRGVGSRELVFGLPGRAKCSHADMTEMFPVSTEGGWWPPS